MILAPLIIQFFESVHISPSGTMYNSPSTIKKRNAVVFHLQLDDGHQLYNAVCICAQHIFPIFTFCVNNKVNNSVNIIYGESSFVVTQNKD